MALSVGLTANTMAVSLLANGDFEAGTGTDLDNWEELGSNPPNALVGYSTSDPASGTGHAFMSIDNTVNPAGTAIFIQQVTPVGSVNEGQTYTLTFDAKMTSLDFTGINVFAQVQFLDSDGSDGGGVRGEVLQSLIPTINTSYQSFTIENLQPLAGADAVLVRFQLSAGAVDGIVNSFQVDNASFQAIPEPSSAGLLLLGALGGLIRRRR